MMAEHFPFWYSAKEVFFGIFVNLEVKRFPKITSYKNLVRFSSVGFKNPTGFAEAICKSAKPAPYFESSNTEFERKGLN